MEKLAKEYYYEDNELAKRIKLLKKKLNTCDIDIPEALELSRELDNLIVRYMSERNK